MSLILHSRNNKYKMVFVLLTHSGCFTRFNSGQFEMHCETQTGSQFFLLLYFYSISVQNHVKQCT